jgi:hypothetical protein
MQSNTENMRKYKVILKSGARINVLATKTMIETTLDKITLDTTHTKLIDFGYNNKHTYIKRDEIVAVDEVTIIE